MKILAILGNFDIQQDLVSSFVSCGEQASDIIPCSYKDSGLFIKDPSNQLMLIEFGYNDDGDFKYDHSESFKIIDLIKAANPTAQIVPIIRSKDPDLILQILKRGIADVLLYPFDLNELNGIISKFSLPARSSARGNQTGRGFIRGKVITVTSYKGGTGVSTLAANLGFCLAELDAIKKKTLILDLSNQSNHCAMLLNAQPTLNINQISKEVNRIESSYLFSSCAWATPNLALIGYEPTIEGIQPIDFEPLSKAIDLLSEVFEYIVIDMPTHTFDGRFLASVDKSDQILLLSTVDITSIRDTRVYLELLKSIGIENSKLRLTINRYDCQSGMFKTKDLEQALQNPVSFYVPNDFATCMQAMQEGQAIVEYKPNSMLAEAIAELAIGIDNGAMFLPPKLGTKKSGIAAFGSIFAGMKK